MYLRDENGRVLAQVTFPVGDDGVVDIRHTFVDESLRGQKIGEKLMEAAAEQIRQMGRPVRFSCSYAVHFFEKHREAFPMKDGRLI